MNADQLLQKLKLARRSRSAAASLQHCWICGSPDSPNHYGSADFPFCDRCGRDVLSLVSATHFSESATEIKVFAQSLQRLPDVLPSAECVDGTLLEDDRDWECYACGYDNIPKTDACAKCKRKRLRLMCPACHQDALATEFCIQLAADDLNDNINAAKLPTHDVWICDGCQARHLSGERCSHCHKVREWYCGTCTECNSRLDEVCALCGSPPWHGRQFSSRKQMEEEMMAFEDGRLVDEEAGERRKSFQRSRSRNRLDRRIRQDLKMEPINAVDDGNCLFRAISFQLTRSEDFHRVVRLKILDYILENKDLYDASIDGGTEAYVAKMRSDKEWGDAYCLAAAANAFEVHLFVVNPQAKRWRSHFRPSTDVDDSRTVFLAFLPEYHYYSFSSPALRSPKTIPLKKLIDPSYTDLSAPLSPPVALPTTSASLVSVKPVQAPAQVHDVSPTSPEPQRYAFPRPGVTGQTASMYRPPSLARQPLHNGHPIVAVLRARAAGHYSFIEVSADEGSEYLFACCSSSATRFYVHNITERLPGMILPPEARAFVLLQRCETGHALRVDTKSIEVEQGHKWAWLTASRLDSSRYHPQDFVFAWFRDDTLRLPARQQSFRWWNVLSQRGDDGVYRLSCSSHSQGADRFDVRVLNDGKDIRCCRKCHQWYDQAQLSLLHSRRVVPDCPHESYVPAADGFL